MPDELITNADYIIPNETELNLLTNVLVTDDASAEKAAKVLLSRDAKIVGVTLGSRCALLVSEDQVIHVDAYEVDVVDTTAAGDAFIGGFASALLREIETEESVRYVMATTNLAHSRPCRQKRKWKNLSTHRDDLFGLPFGQAQELPYRKICPQNELL